MVAVVVTRDAGPWFVETLRALAAQDHPRLAVLVIDNAGEVDPTPVVQEILPAAVVRRAETDEGFGAAANRVRGLVEGATFYLFCHDDVAPEPDAVSILVDEALRSNAGVVAPKLVSWEDDRRLLAVGATADRTGTTAPLVERGELDQEQHDRVRDVLWVPGAMTLVRCDLFEELDGFDEEISYLGEDLDLCWRAHVAGARVLVAPDAAARHLEALGERREGDDRRRLQHRHRIRTLLGVSSRLRLLLVVPLALALTAGEALFGLVSGSPRHARDVMGAWSWNLRRPRSLFAKRKQVASSRKVADGELTHLQMQGSARIRAFVQGQINRGDRLTSLSDAGRSLASSLTVGAARTAALAWLLVVMALAVATRHLLTRGMPAHREFLAFPLPSELRDVVVDGYRSSWLGTDVEPPLAPLLVGVADVLPGTYALLRTVLVLGPILVGLIGTWRLLTPFGSRRASIVGIVVAASGPLPAAALSGGSWTILTVWAASPWILARLARLAAVEPFVVGAPGGRRIKPVSSQIAGLAIVLAVVVAFAPVMAPITLAMALALLVGSLVAGDGVVAAGRAVVLSIAAVIWAAVLHGPWVAGVIGDRPPWRLLYGRGLVDEFDGLAALLRADIGPVGNSVLGWGPLLVAVVPLLLGQGWRFAWSVRLAVLWIAAVGVAWVELRGWSGDVVLPDPALLLAVAAPAVAMAAGLAISTYERDVRGYRFGWRQLVPIAGAVGLVAIPLPAFATLPDGRFEVPTADLAASATFLDDASDVSRVLWLGEVEVLPLPGIILRDDLTVAVSDGFPDLRDAWPATSFEATRPVFDAVDALLAGESARFGELLAPLGVRYVVVVQASAPSFTEVPTAPIAPDVLDRLEQQLDLRLVPTDPALIVFRNEAWFPVDAVVPAGAGELVAEGLDGLTAIDPAQIAAPPAIAGADTSVYVARRPVDRIDVTIGGDPVSGEVFGAGQIAAAGAGGAVAVDVERPSGRTLVLVALAIAWAITAWLAARGWSAQGRAITDRLLEQAERADPIAYDAALSDDGGRRRRRRRSRRAGRRREPDVPEPVGVE